MAVVRAAILAAHRALLEQRRDLPRRGTAEPPGRVEHERPIAPGGAGVVGEAAIEVANRIDIAGGGLCSLGR